MKTGLRIALGIVATIALVVVVLSAGWFFWGRCLWAPGTMGGPGGYTDEGGVVSWKMGAGRTGGREGPETMQGGYSSSLHKALSSEQAQEAVEAYVKNSGYIGLEIGEVMEFQHNFYAIVCEHDTGIGAMELLVDKSTGAVLPEMGPNMMWNARYGMHRGDRMMRGRTGDVNTLSEEQVVEIAQRWLDANRPGVAAEEHTDPFYGYYTIHTVKDGGIEGMLSIHGTTGQVWYHTWHGGFVQMIEGEQDHD